jgi:hypothetical protein
VQEFDDHIEVNGITIHKPFVEKPVNAESQYCHLLPTSTGGAGPLVLSCGTVLYVHNRHNMSPCPVSARQSYLTAILTHFLATIMPVAISQDWQSVFRFYPSSKVRRTAIHLRRVCRDARHGRENVHGRTEYGRGARKSPAVDGQVQRSDSRLCFSHSHVSGKGNCPAYRARVQAVCVWI